jgi:hypothetical protein
MSLPSCIEVELADVSMFVRPTAAQPRRSFVDKFTNYYERDSYKF